MDIWKVCRVNRERPYGVLCLFTWFSTGLSLPFSISFQLWTLILVLARTHLYMTDFQLSIHRPFCDCSHTHIRHTHTRTQSLQWKSMVFIRWPVSSINITLKISLNVFFSQPSWFVCATKILSNENKSLYKQHLVYSVCFFFQFEFNCNYFDCLGIYGFWMHNKLR